MNGNEGESGRLSTGFDPAIQSEKLGFEPEQMVACESCGRKNPPNRVACLYCAGALTMDPTTVEAIIPGLKKPEMWERGFNLVVRPSEIGLTVDVARASQVLSVDMNELDEIIHSSIPLPIARLGTERDAREVSTILSKLGLPTLMVSDLSLGADRPPKRLRSIGFGENSISLKLFNSVEEVLLPISDLLLAVEGVISESRVDQLEKRRLRGNNKVLDGSSSASIEPVLDVYTRDDLTGYRIQPVGFDFSSLGRSKGMLFADNLRALAEKIVNFSPSVRYIGEYRVLRQLLGNVWQIESKQESTGLRHTGLGQKAFGTVSSTSNLNQFTMFSRLQRQLL